MTVNRADDQLRRQTLDLLRFPLAVVVLTIHVWTLEGGPMIQGVSSSFENYPVLTALNHIIDGFLRSQSVPIYFFISGYVFFYGVDMVRETYIRKFKNRVRTLLIPYIIWNMAALGFMLLIHSLSFLSHYSSDTGSYINFTFKGFLSCFYNFDYSIVSSSTPPLDDVAPGPINGPLWFLRELMTMVLLSPILYRLLMCCKKYAVMIFGLLWFCLVFYTPETHSGIYVKSQLTPALFFFSWGAYMSIFNLDMLSEFKKWFSASMILYPVLALLYIAGEYTYPVVCPVIKQVNIVVGLLFAYNLAAWLLTTGRCKLHPFLAASSFFIYVSHGFLAKRIVRLMFVIINPTSDAMMIFAYSFATVLLTVLLLFTFWLLRRYAPGVLKVVAGRK